MATQATPLDRLRAHKPHHNSSYCPARVVYAALVFVLAAKLEIAFEEQKNGGGGEQKQEDRRMVPDSIMHTESSSKPTKSNVAHGPTPKASDMI